MIYDVILKTELRILCCAISRKQGYYNKETELSHK